MPGRIVRYSAARSLARASYRRMPRRYQLAIRGAQAAYRYRRYAKPMYKVAKWGVRRWRARKAQAAKRRKIGHNKGSSNCKQNVTWESDQSGINTRQLYRVNMLLLPKQTSSGEKRDERIRDVVNFRGWKFCFQARNDTLEPIKFHWALIQPKRPSEFELNLERNFFRSPGTEERAVDFSNTLTGLELDCNPINTDQFNVIHHKKFELGPKNNATGDVTNNKYNNGNGRNWYTFNRYIPLKRQVRYDSEGAPESGLYFVYWCDTFQSNTAAPDIVNAVIWQSKMTAYFRETATL